MVEVLSNNLIICLERMDEVSTSSSSIFLVEQFTNLKFIDQQNIR